MSTRTSFLSDEELHTVGFQHLGVGVMLSRKASIYRAHQISVGDHSRIDDFCVLSAGDGGIRIGHNVHIAVYASLIGAELIVVGDYSNISSRVSLYSSNDDYSGQTMTNPTVEDDYKNVTHAPLRIGRHVIVGSGSVVLPGVTLGDGVCIGALSLVNCNCEPFTICAGVPAKRIRERDRGMLSIEQRRDKERRRGD